MAIRARIHLFVHLLTVVSLILSAVTPVFAAPIPDAVAADTYAVQTPQAGPDVIYRTRVALKNAAARQRFDRLDLVVLEQGDDWALVLVDEGQLADLARLRFDPSDTESLGGLVATSATTSPWLSASLQSLLAQAQAMRGQVAAAGADGTASADALHAAMASLTREQRAALAEPTSIDDDGDGLTNTQEQWWCTDALNPDSDGDGTSDGDEVAAAKAWLANEAGGPPASGKPFSGWPATMPNCPDDDQDSVPDLAERWELGLNMNRESTDRDKCDDGQELFGNTYCPGSGGFCGYGVLPRNEDWGVIFAEMPAWVKTPGNHPLVAALPSPSIDVNESSLNLQTVSVITTDHTISQGTERIYSTAKSQGTSTSVANTDTWNEWQEVSRTSPVSSQVQASSVNIDAEWAKPVDTVNTFISDVCTAATGTPIHIYFDAGCLAQVAGTAIGNGINEATYLTFLHGPKVVESVSNGLEEFQNRTKQNLHILGDNIGRTYRIARDAVGQFARTISSQDRVTGVNDHYLETLDNSQASIQPTIQLSIQAQRPTVTNSRGQSRGGSQTLTTEEYEEHTVTNGEAFSTSEAWGTATAEDSSHAADLWFTYTVRNTGTEYAREIADLAFNLYIGDDPNPAYTYFVAPDMGGDGKLHNFMPDEEHAYTSRRIPLTLEQMKAIDLGGPIRIVVEDFTYGIDELFYQDAANAGLLVAMEDGTDDGDESIDPYLIPTWGNETALDVLARYFPHETDADGTLVSIWTPEYTSSTPSWCQEPFRPSGPQASAVWCKHALSTADWWNIYTNGLGDGSQGFQETPATPGSVALFRFNKDSDLDGFSDRSEVRLGTDANDAVSFPRPELLAGVHSQRSGNDVVATLSLLNTGLYDAYGVEAIMVAPDDTTTITNNTVGGSGRVRALNQVIVGSRILLESPLPAAWTQADHATPAAGGYFTGDADRTYAFTVSGCGAGGCSVGAGTWSLDWSDDAGNSGSLNFDAGYASPTFLPVGDQGLTLALYSGQVANGESFTVEARTPRDTFQYTINQEPFTEPLVVVSYNDPQGNHRFIVPPAAMALATPNDDLTAFAGQMLPDVGVEIVTTAPFTPGANATDLLVNNPSATQLTNANLFLEFIDPQGTVVLEASAQADLPPGPSYVTVNWDSASFDPAYDAAQDYIVLAFLTDYEGNILDTGGRPLSSFQADPLPQLVADDASLTWDFGTVAQGALLRHRLSLANTGFGKLNTYIKSDQSALAVTSTGHTLEAAQSAYYELSLDTNLLPVGPVSFTAMLQSSDVDRIEVPISISGEVVPQNGSILARSTENQPLNHWFTLTDTVSADLWIPINLDIDWAANPMTPLYLRSESRQILGSGITINPPIETGWMNMLTNGGFESGNLSGWQIASGTWEARTGPRDTGWMSLLQNGGFEAGNFGSWSVGGGNWVVETFDMSSSRCHTCPKSVAKKGGTNPGWIAQEINLSSWRSLINIGAGSIDARGYVRTQDGGDKGRVVVKLQSGNTVLQTYDSGYNAPGYYWRENRLATTLPTGTDRIRFEFWLDTDGDGDCKVDSGSVEVRMNYADPAQSGAYKVHSQTAGNPSSIYQEISLSNWQEWIARGIGTIRAGAWAKSIDSADQLRIQFVFYSDGQELPGSGYDSGWVTPMNWTEYADEQPIPETADTVRLALSSTGDADALLDSAYLNLRFQYMDHYLEPVIPDGTKIQVRFSEEMNVGQIFEIQSALVATFTTWSDQMYPIKLANVPYNSIQFALGTLDKGFVGTTFLVDVGNNGSVDWSGIFPDATLFITSPDLAEAFNTELASSGGSPEQLTQVPIAVTVDSANATGSGVVVLTALTLESNPIVDLSIDSLTPVSGSSIDEATTIAVQAPVHNLSSISSGPLTAAFFATLPNWGDWYIGSDFVPDIPAGGSANVSIDWETTGFRGDVPVKVVVSPYDPQLESNVANNQAESVLTIRARPDLLVDSIALDDDEPLAGETVTVDLALRNQGQQNAGDQTTALYEGNPDSGGTEIGAQAPGGLAGEAAATLVFDWTPVTPGPYRLFSRTDRDNAVDEYDEGNNERWRDVYVGLASPVTLDSGAASDVAYAPETGYGYVDEGQPDVIDNCGAEPHQTFRRDPDGRVTYRFDHLQPGHFYHLNITMFECMAAGRQQNIYVDGNLVAGPVDLGDGQIHTQSIRLDPALYADRSITVTVEDPSIDGALVSEIELVDVDYRYADAGGPVDPEYSVANGYGWLDGTSSTAWGSLPYQSVRVDQTDAELRYRFDNLDPAALYRLNFTFWQPNGQEHIQKVLVNDIDIGVEVDTGDYQVHRVSAPIPPDAYAIGDHSVIVTIRRLNGESGAMVNEIALEIETLGGNRCTAAITPYRMDVYGSVTIDGQPAPVGTVVQAINPRGDTVGCFTVTQAGQYGFMPIYGEDASQTPAIPGMRDGEMVLFKVNGILAMAAPPAVWRLNDSLQIDLNAGGVQDQSIALRSGWNLISTYIEPLVPAIRQALGSIDNRYDRVLGENVVFAPALDDAFNTLEEIHSGEGYYLRTVEEATTYLLTQGAPTPPDTPIELHAGWNWIGYLPTGPLDVAVTLQNIDGLYQRVLSLDKAYVAALPDFSNLHQLQPGEGYLIYMDQAATLTYPTGAAAANADNDNQSWSTACLHVNPTPFSTLVYGHLTVNGGDVPPGVLVEVLTPGGDVAGCFRVETAGQYGLMHVYGLDDAGPSSIPGFAEGEALRFRVNGVEITPDQPLVWRDDKAPHQVNLNIEAADFFRSYLPSIFTGFTESASEPDASGPASLPMEPKQDETQNDPDVIYLPVIEH